MSTPRSIREARRMAGYPWGHQDPDEEDFEPIEAGDVDLVEIELVIADDVLASKAEDRDTAWRDSTASQ